MKDKVELDIFYPHPPEQVWEALTESEALAGWLMPGEIKPIIGFRFRLERTENDAIVGKVIEVEDGKLLAYTWDDGESPEPSVVVWRLDPKDGGTQVHLEHRHVETPEVTRLPIEAYFNWEWALCRLLTLLLDRQILCGGIRCL